MNPCLPGKFIKRSLLVGISLLSAYLFFKYLFTFISPFIVAFLVALALEPLVRFFERRLRLSRWIASLFGMLLFILGIGYLGAALVNTAWQQAVQFTAQLPGLISGAMDLIDDFLYNSNAAGVLTTLSPPWLGGFGSNLTEAIAEFARNSIGDGVAHTSLVLFRSLPHFVMWIVLFTISTFFFIKDRQFIHDTVMSASPPELKAWFTKLHAGLVRAFTGYLKAQGIIMSAIAVVNIGALMLHGYEYALFMGLLIAVIDALPFIGSSLIFIPWALVSFAQGATNSGFYLLALLGINFLVRQLLEPKVLSASIGLHPILTLASLYIGLRLLGPPGLVVGPMIAMMIKIMSKSNEHNLRS